MPPAWTLLGRFDCCRMTDSDWLPSRFSELYCKPGNNGAGIRSRCDPWAGFPFELARRVRFEGSGEAPCGDGCGLRPEVRFGFGGITAALASNNSATIGMRVRENVTLKRAIATRMLDRLIWRINASFSARRTSLKQD